MNNACAPNAIQVLEIILTKSAAWSEVEWAPSASAIEIPRYTKITSSGILFALGQSFFALSIGVTAMLTYASYLDRRTNLVQSGISVVLMNIAVSVMAGLAIFPAMSSFDMESEGGPSLLFIVLPQLFNNMAFR